MTCNPLLPQVGDTLIPQPLLGQGALNDAIARHPPVPLTATRGQCDLVTRYPQGSQVASTRARPLPLFPVAQPYPPPAPLVQLDQLRITATVAEGVEPSGDIPLQSLDAACHTPPLLRLVISRTRSLNRLTAASVHRNLPRLNSKPRKVHALRRAAFVLIRLIRSCKRPSMHRLMVRNTRSAAR